MDYLSYLFPSPSSDETLIGQREVGRILAREEVSVEDVKTLFRAVRYAGGHDERFEYANTLLPGASDYLRAHTLRALVRAEISEKDAEPELERNKAFCSRLANLLPSIVRFLSTEARSRNPWGIVSMLDDCHGDFHHTVDSSRRDRQIRVAKEKIAKAGALATELAAALDDTKRHFDIEFDRYRSAYYELPSDFPPSHSLRDLIEELRMCSGILEVMNATADVKPKRLFLYGNDERTNLVEWAYHMSTMWNGPKLVTTPNSDFTMFCSLLFEAVSGKPEEALAGAINRYARSQERKEWDRSGEGEDEKDKDNFMIQRWAITSTTEEIRLSKALLKNAQLSDRARVVLYARILHEQKKQQEAEDVYGPNQVYADQMNDDQHEQKLAEATNQMNPAHVKKLDAQIASEKTKAVFDIERGQAIRAGRQPDDST